MAENSPAKSITPAETSKWVDEHGDYLFRFALSRLNDKSLSEDMVQETFLAALKNIKNFDNRSSIRTWFTSILKNKIIDHYRKKARAFKEEDLDALDDYKDDFLENGHWKAERAPVDWGMHPEKALNQKEFMQVLRACLAALPEKIAAVFALREIELQESQDICNDLGISSSNLWVMLHRARNGLRKCLELNWFGKKAGK